MRRALIPLGWGAAVLLGAGGLVVGANGSPSALALAPGSQTFTYTGAPQDFTVPADVTAVSAAVCGASGEWTMLGGSQVQFTGRPGAGGCVLATVLVTPGEVLHVRVGGHAPAASTAGWPDGGDVDCPNVGCGGAGGGSSDIRSSGDALTDRIVVGGGGGGGGSKTAAGLGGSGGNGGGNGLDLLGQAGFVAVGFTDPIAESSMGGRGGNANSGGAGGCGIATVDIACSDQSTFANGWLYSYGKWAVSNVGANGQFGTEAASGGGGGGWFGGGSGASSSDARGAAGGGGGSSYVDPNRVVSYTAYRAAQTAYDHWLAGEDVLGDNGSVTISWPAAVPATTTTVAVTTTTVVPTTLAPTAASTTTAVGAGGGAATTTTVRTGLPSVGSGDAGLRAAWATVALGGALLLVARRRPH